MEKNNKQKKKLSGVKSEEKNFFHNDDDDDLDVINIFISTHFKRQNHLKKQKMFIA